MLWSIQYALAQNAVLHITLKNSAATSCYVWIPGRAFTFDYLKKAAFDVPLVKEKGKYVLGLSKPEFVYLKYSPGDSANAQTKSYQLYLSPGDDLYIYADINNKNNPAVITGRGSRNNQPLIAAAKEADTRLFKGDTLPNRIIAYANQHQHELESALHQYISRYQPSADFIRNERINIEYDALYQYYNFKEVNKFDITQAYDRNASRWQAVQDSLLNRVKLNDGSALTAINYTSLLKTFLWYEKMRLWGEKNKDPEAFFKQWYQTDAAKGAKDFETDRQNRLQEKIINHYFTNGPAEYLYAVLFDDALGEHYLKNAVSIFDNFRQRFPHSSYVAWFGPAINEIREKEKQPPGADIVLLPDNGTRLNTFDEVLALAKGKTILLDMWGTWCLPCRNEIHDNGPAIKAYFKGKGLDYFYVANNDLQRVTEWKKLITYLNMTGTHILANPVLSKDIMTKVQGPGYPTYVIIKKDGTWELSKASYPMNRKILIKQLEEALNQ